MKKIQACVTLLLVIFIVALGSLTFLVLRNSELGSFENSFESAAIFLSKGVGDAIDRQTRSGSHVNHLFATAMSRGYSGLLPNFTMPDYEETVDVIGGIAGLRYVAFSPLVTASSRHAWETYAALNADLLGGPPSLTTSTAGSWTIANGICDFGSTGYPLNEKCYPAPSSNSSTYFPIWQVAPIDQNVALVMVDVYSLYAGRATSVIDQAIKYRKPHFTDFETLVQDVAGVDRPSTVMYTPISSNEVGNAVVGLLSGGFSWDDFLSGVLPDEYEKIDCVVSSKTG